MSSGRVGLKRGSITQHRPQDVDPPARQRDQSLGVPLALSPLAIVEGSGLRSASQAREGRLVEHSLEDLVAATHPFVVADPFAGVVGRRYQSGVGGEPVCTLEGREISYSDQKLCSEKRTHPWQASQDLRFRAGEKTLLELLVDALDALFESKRLLGEFCNDARGYVLCG